MHLDNDINEAARADGITVRTAEDDNTEMTVSLFKTKLTVNTVYYGMPSVL